MQCCWKNLKEYTLCLRALKLNLSMPKKVLLMRAKAKRSGIHCLVLHIGDIKDPRVKRTKKHHLTMPVSAIGDLSQPRFWAGLQSVVMLVRVRHLWNKTKE